MTTAEILRTITKATLGKEVHPRIPYTCEINYDNGMTIGSVDSYIDNGQGALVYRKGWCFFTNKAPSKTLYCETEERLKNLLNIYLKRNARWESTACLLHGVDSYDKIPDEVHVEREENPDPEAMHEIKVTEFEIVFSQDVIAGFAEPGGDERYAEQLAMLKAERLKRNADE